VDSAADSFPLIKSQKSDSSEIIEFENGDNSKTEVIAERARELAFFRSAFSRVMLISFSRSAFSRVPYFFPRFAVPDFPAFPLSLLPGLVFSFS
jgi:hypothetical protein